MTDKRMIFLASPYSGYEDKQYILNRTGACCFLLQQSLTQYGYTVYSPILSNHHGALFLGKETDHEAFKRNSARAINNSAAVVVACLSGWDKSRGIQWELGYADGVDIPVWYLHNPFPHMDQRVELTDTIPEFALEDTNLHSNRGVWIPDNFPDPRALFDEMGNIGPGLTE